MSSLVEDNQIMDNSNISPQPPSINTVGLRPKHIYGLRTNVVGNIHFNLQQEVIYPVEGVLAFHDFVENKQRFLRLPEDTIPLIIQISPHRKLLAILEKAKPKSGNGKNNGSKSISIYDLHTLKKRRTLELPNGSKHAEISQILFTGDSKALTLLTKGPDEMIYMILMDKLGTVYEGRACPTNGRFTAECLACNPQDTSLLAVGGNNLLTLQTKSDKGFNITNNLKSNFLCTSMAFLAMDLLMVGTSSDELILVENGEYKLRQKASDAEVFDLLMDQETFDREQEQRPQNNANANSKLYDSRVVCMTAFAKGFAFAIFNRVYVFERVSKFKFERKTILTIPITIYAEHLYQITNLAVDSKQETVIVTAEHSQIYVGILIVPETLKAKHLQFQPLGALIHIDDIVDISLCSWKPIIMTASRDQTVRIWNYETEKVELVRKFQVDVNIVELNSTGLIAAIGFSDQLRITQIFMEELNIVKTYNFPRCKDVKYSNYGHLMAAAYNSTIAITSVYNLEILITLKGHNGTVLSVAWTKNDKYLISGGNEGAIYQWDVDNGNRLQEIVQKGTEYVSVCSTFNDPLSIFAVNNSGLLREFQNSEIVREVSIPSSSKCRLTDVCLARSDTIMFVANEMGDLVNVQLPFLDAGGGTCSNFRFFMTAVNKVRFSYDGTLLMTVSKAGTLAIWALENIEGKVASMDQDLLKSQEVLIPRAILAEKNEQIVNLETRLKQQAEEFQYQLSQNEIFDGQQMAEVHRSYCQALEELKRINAEAEERHRGEMNQITFQINEMKEEHKKQLDNLATQYSERMLIEYQKFTNLRENMLELRESYENKLKKSAGTLQDTVESLENDYKKQLDERRELIRELMQEMEDKKSQFTDYCQQVEEENEQRLSETVKEYEKKLLQEREATELWRGKSGVLQKKYESLTKDVDNLLEEVETLKEQHTKSQRNITKLNRTIEDLQKDISDRDYAINNKEKRIQELLHKNQELDKYKQVLNHKIAELKAQIEPREFQINDKRKHILELENELAGLNQNNSQLELQLKELKDKYISTVAELKVERHRARAGRECVQNLCSEIYHVAGLMNTPDKLKAAVRELFQRHASDDELKRFISLDANVRDEFQRQRNQIERVLKIYSKREEDKTQKRKYDKLFKENVVLLEEIDKMREENKMLRAHLKREMSTKKSKSRSAASNLRQKSGPIRSSEMSEALKDYSDLDNGAVGGGEL
ncbi:cilia- and flagella-associated protein 57 [Musca vetustissima]|uniref:cilia- and flagella-associated protein 57 n=1 Tax=Musca vetustissima TaxID=27455 RepID=UPI002AB7B3BD|nr:cilia- and flagella-associated protein 57 [Musca vetustissima]